MSNSDQAALNGAACCDPLVKAPISEDCARELSVVFKALGDPVRLRLVSLIAAGQEGEACVCDLVAAFSLSQPTISHHLKVLREAGVLDADRRGTWIYYSLVPGALERLTTLLDGSR